MTISIKDYAAQAGISVQAAHKRLKSDKYSRFLTVDEHGRKSVNTAIFDIQPDFQPVSTDSTRFSTKVERSSTDLVENSTTDSTFSTCFSTKLVEKSTNASTKVENDSTFSTNVSTTDSTEVERKSTVPGEDTTISAILQLKLDYAQRDIARLEEQLEAMREQITAKDNLIAELNERLREAHILTLEAARRKPRSLLTDIAERFRGRKAGQEERDTDAAGSEKDDNR